MIHLAMMKSLTHLIVQPDILLFAEMKIGVKRGIVEISLSINGSDGFHSSTTSTVCSARILFRHAK